MTDIFVYYLPQFFDWVLKTSIMASIAVGLILIVKTLLRNKLTSRWNYLLWMILIVRLLLPWSPDSSFSIYSILSYGYKTIISFQTQPEDNLNKERIHVTTAIHSNKNMEKEHYAAVSQQKMAKESNDIISNKAIVSDEKQKNTPISFHTIILYIWLIGVFALSLTTYCINRRLYNFIKKQPVITDKRITDIFENCKKTMSVQNSIPIVLAGKISSPTVLGFFRPRVLLSRELINQLTDPQLRHIFYHELAHIKRRDVGVNWIMHSLLIINWFNPILWFAYFCMRDDQELACDAYALTFMEEEEKISYGHTIISLLEHFSNFYQAPGLANLSRNKKNIKRRIFMIKKFQKKSHKGSAISVIAVIAVSSLTLLNAHADGSNGKTKEQTSSEKVATNEIKKEKFKIHITAEEQNMIENSNVQSGFFQQENGTGFFFYKSK
ncbi:M56 family metallopeptidase [Rummeliibacillus pycnus]|uniref:M56 family metallopeptidase n=1 Tax=Rummeliibacillus pycnus TaxID=101070 RepID=UPI0037C694E1